MVPDMLVSQLSLMPEQMHGLGTYLRCSRHGQALGEIWETARNSTIESNVRSKALLGATAVGLAFEWGVGNEALVGWSAGSTFEQSGNEALTAVVASSTAMGEQFVVGALIAATLNAFPRVMKKVNEHYGSTEDTETTRPPTLAARFIEAFSMGSSYVLIMRNKDRHHTTKENLTLTAKTCAFIGAGVLAVAGGVFGVGKAAEELGVENAQDTLANVATNPWTWISLFGVNKFLTWRSNQKELKAKIANHDTL